MSRVVVVRISILVHKQPCATRDTGTAVTHMVTQAVCCDLIVTHVRLPCSDELLFANSVHVIYNIENTDKFRL
jgi:hypothetical protein